MVGVFAGFQLGSNPILFAAPLVILYALLMLLPSRVTLHDDGVRISWLGRTRYVPYRSILAVSTVSREEPWLFRRRGEEKHFLALKLSTDNGDIVLGTGVTSNSWWGSTSAKGYTAHLHALLDSAWSQFRDLSQGQDVAAAHLTRDGQSVDEWVRRVERLVHADIYRATALSIEKLWKLVEDPTVPPTARAGAAVALRASLNEEGRTRLRVASEAIGSPKLRVAITKVAEESEEAELREALSHIEDASEGVRT